MKSAVVTPILAVDLSLFERLELAMLTSEVLEVEEAL